MKILSLIFISIMLFTSSIFSAQWTVLKAKGDTQVKIENEWLSPRKGQALTDENSIRIGQKSLMRILSPEGRILNLKKSQETSLGDLRSKKKKAVATISVLDELVTNKSIIRMNAVRGAENLLEAKWQEFITAERLSKKNIELYLELAVAYLEQAKLNRSYFIISKLESLYQQRNGFSTIKQSISKNQLRGSWKAKAYKNGVNQSVTSGISLKEGDEFKFSYKSRQETFLYVFFTSHPNNKTVQTYTLHPEENTQTKAINKNKTIYFPNNEDWFALDNQSGTEIFWAVEGYGPIHPTTLKNLQTLVENNKKIETLEVMLQETLGDIGQVYLFTIQHL